MASRTHESLQGFTLIELVVVVGILLLIGSGVIVNYNAFNENQRVKQVALTLKTNLRLAQTKALSGYKPQDPYTCNELEGYTVTFTANQYSTQAKCASPDDLQGDVTSVTLPTGITLSALPATPILEFYVNQGTNLVSDVTITLQGQKRYAITVSPNGSMNDLGLVE